MMLSCPTLTSGAHRLLCAKLRLTLTVESARAANCAPPKAGHLDAMLSEGVLSKPTTWLRLPHQGNLYERLFTTLPFIYVDSPPNQEAVDSFFLARVDM